MYRLIEYSALKLMVGWNSLRLSINSFGVSSPCCHLKKYNICHHTYGPKSKFCRILSSRSNKNKMESGGSNFVPIALLAFFAYMFLGCNWKYCFPKIFQRAPPLCQLTFLSPSLSEGVSSKMINLLHEEYWGIGQLH